MKKRHLYIILLALLTSLLMLLPVFAEGMRGADPGEKPAGPPAEEELSQAAAQAESTEPPAQTGPSAESETLSEPDWGLMFDRARAQVSCSGHRFDEPRPYSDTKQVRSCVLCGYENYGCAHEYSSWISYRDVQMVRTCFLCLHNQAIPMQQFNCTHEGWTWIDIAEHAQMRECSACGNTEYRQNSAHVHEYSDWGDYSKERIGRTCLICGRPEFLIGEP